MSARVAGAPARAKAEVAPAAAVAVEAGKAGALEAAASRFVQDASAKASLTVPTRSERLWQHSSTRKLTRSRVPDGSTE